MDRAVIDRVDARKFNEAFRVANPELEKRNLEILRSWDDLPSKVRTDNNATAFLARELVYVRAEIERTIYERLRAADFIDMDPSFPRGAESYAVKTLGYQGQAKVSTTLAGDHPRADASMGEDLRKFVNVTASYAYTTEDMERSAFSQVPLPSYKREATVDAIVRRLDAIAQYGTAGDGEGDVGLRGFFNNANVPTLTLPEGEWNLAGTTPAQILTDLFEIESTIIANARDTQPTSGYRLILPTAYEGHLITRPVGTGDLTVGQYFLRNARIVREITRWDALGALTAPRVSVADAPQGIAVPIDARSAGIYMPLPIAYDEMTPEVRNFEMVINARARCGGVEFRRPFWGLYFQNLD